MNGLNQECVVSLVDTLNPHEHGAIVELAGEVERLRSMLEDTRSALGQAATDRDRARRRCRELESFCVTQQEQLYRAFERLAQSDRERTIALVAAR